MYIYGKSFQSIQHNTSVRIMDLVYHTTYVACVNFLQERQDLQFKVDSARQIFWATFHGVFTGSLLRESHRINIFRFWCLNSGLTSNKSAKTNINYRKSLYCFSKYFPLRSIHLCMRLNQFSKHFCHSDWGLFTTSILNPSTASSGVEKR